MSELGLGDWDPLAPDELAELLRPCPTPWWIAGGLAVDAFVGQPGRRSHDDVDLGLLARDQDAIRAALQGWQLFCADPPGALRPWNEEERLEEPVHDVWARPAPGEPWRIALALNPSAGDSWVYRRDPRIVRPVPELVFERDGIPYLVPEVQLLFKSKGTRPKDEQDFDDAAPLLDSRQRAWLRAALELATPGHPWLERLQ